MSNIYLYSTAELLALPEPEWLIEDFVHCEETMVLWGEPNAGKTFLSLDMALSVATGLNWLNTYPVRQCPVIYMAGEGGGSLQKRVAAWMEARDVLKIPSAYFQLRAIPFLDESIVEEVQQALEEYLEEQDYPQHEPGLNAGLLVIDTLSQFFGGGNEVEGPDMAMFVGNVRRLAQEAGMTVIIVHHSNATGGRERGHSSLRGNVDVMFEIKGFKKDGRLLGMSLTNDKQRDNPTAPKLYVEVVPVREGLVIYPSDAQRLTRLQEYIPLADEKLVDVLRAFELVESDKSETCLHTDLMEQVGLQRQRLHEQLRTLKQLQLIVTAGRGKSALTLLGRETIAQAMRAKRGTARSSNGDNRSHKGDSE